MAPAMITKTFAAVLLLAAVAVASWVPYPGAPRYGAPQYHAPHGYDERARSPFMHHISRATVRAEKRECCPATDPDVEVCCFTKQQCATTTKICDCTCGGGVYLTSGPCPSYAQPAC